MGTARQTARVAAQSNSIANQWKREEIKRKEEALGEQQGNIRYTMPEEKKEVDSPSKLER